MHSSNLHSPLWLSFAWYPLPPHSISQLFCSLIWNYVLIPQTGKTFLLHIVIQFSTDCRASLNDKTELMQTYPTQLSLFVLWGVLYSQQKQDRRLTMVQIMNSLLPNSDLNWRNYGQIRPFRYDLNQIRYDYIVEVRNRFKGLDLIEWRKNYGPRFVTLYRRQWSDHP